MSNSEIQDSVNEIAIVGMAGRFPGARNIREFWRMLRVGKESVRFFSPEELQTAGVPTALIENPNYVSACCEIEDAESFDAPFFGYTPRESRFMDPQHRLFLECAW